MQNLQDIQEKIFFECKNILESLSKINSSEELLAKQELFAEITDRIAFLRILDKNKKPFLNAYSAQKSEFIEGERVFKDLSDSDENFEDSLLEEDVIEEEVIFTNELNDYQQEEKGETESANIIQESPTEDPVKIDETPGEVIEELSYDERVAQKERAFHEMEEKRRKIVEFNKEDVVHPAQEVPEELPNNLNLGEKKFKLANIKGLKAVQNLFDEDHLETPEHNIKPTSGSDFGSIAKTNIPTDFMEAEKRKPEFKLDLNDKVTFIKHLFNGDADELKVTIDQLNSYHNLEDAKQYLSDIYYAKNWSKADEYAQRLWNLVENKFL